VAYDPLDFTEPNVCVDEHLTTDDAGQPVMQPWAVPRLVVDARGMSGADGKMYPERARPGKLLIDLQRGWRNDSPLDAMVLLRITRASRAWITSNPNAIQFRDRFTTVIDPDDIRPEVPITTGIFDSQVGSALDRGTNSVAEPNPGRQWGWADTNCEDRWLGPVPPGEKLNVWYRAYVWTPDPWSNNANKNAPLHRAWAYWSRLQLTAFPTQGNLVTGG